MAKIYRHNLNYDKKNLNYVLPNNNDIQHMLDSVYEESDFLNENDNDNQEEDLILDEVVEEEIQITDEVLNVETSISLGPWVFIDNTVLPNITRTSYESEDEEDWDPEELIEMRN